MSGSFNHDFNGAEAQQNAFEVIPAGTLVKVRLSIRPGGVGPEGWVTQSRTSDAQYLNVEAVVLDGPHSKRRIYTRIGLRGKGGQGADDSYANRGRSLIRGILESARGVSGKDTSDRARLARTIRGYGDLNGLEFLARLGGLHYVLLPYRRGYYDLSASGGLIDALTWLKPVIATRVPLTEQYLGEYGDIGLLCEDAAGLGAAVDAVLAAPDAARYDRQVAALAAARETRAVEALATRYRA
jgi:glycosyltransferase involved in cell wall biosynthesis